MAVNPMSKSFNFSSGTQDAEITIDWGGILESILQNFWVILGATLAGFVGASLYVMRLPDVYTANAKVRVEMFQEAAALDYKEMASKLEQDRATYYGTQIELIQSSPVLERAAQDIELPKRFNSTVTQAAMRLRNQLGVNLVRGTEIIIVSITGEDPALASQMANAVANAYIKLNADSKVRVPKEFQSLFLNDGEILRDKESLDRLRSMSDQDRIAVLPTITQDPMINKLKDEQLSVQNQIAEYLSRYTAEHPRVKELKLRADNISSEIARQTERLLAALKSAVEGDYNIQNTTIIEASRPPAMPSGPNRSRMVMMGTLLSFVLSICGILFFYFFFRKINLSDDLKGVSDLAFLGYVPEILVPRQKGIDRQQYVVAQMHTNVQLLDAIHDVRNNLFFSMPKDHNKIIMCSSLLPSEGKSSISAMLALSMANLGKKVLIVDGDMRNPTAHLCFGKKNVMGLSNCLIGQQSWKELLIMTEQSPTLRILPAGNKAPNSTALLGSQQMVKLLNEFREEFDLVMIDVPPLMYIPDALILGQKVDGMFLVIKAGYIDLKMLQQIKEKIDSLKIILIGAILNRTDMRKVFKGYYHKYGSSYYAKRKKS
jgi:capsular exopolysaccharide synthesis family protein